MPEFLGLPAILQLMNDQGCKQVFAKILSENDNNKNQPYFGHGFEALNIFPALNIYAELGKPHFKASLDYYWLDESGQQWKAPNAQLILYPKYPEVRFSGFLKGCQHPPSVLMTQRLAGRVLFLGIRDDGKVLGYVVAPESEAAQKLRARTELNQAGVFLAIPATERADNQTTKQILLDKLRDIHLSGWLDSVRLQSDGTTVECRSSNCGGYTLEAQLGITPNGISEPDFLGWEVKQHGVKNFNNIGTEPITLMTPEPQAGYYKEEGVIPFILKYGYPDTKEREDRMNFGGIHIVGRQTSITGLTMTLTGYDAIRGKIVDPQGGLELLDAKCVVAARWNFTDLMAHWNRKHAFAVYVPSLIRTTPSQSYAYGSIVRLGEGTDFLRFLKAMSDGDIYYDPGIKIENLSSGKPTTKRRSQFRIKSKNLGSLYSSFVNQNVLEQE